MKFLAIIAAVAATIIKKKGDGLVRPNTLPGGLSGCPLTGSCPANTSCRKIHDHELCGSANDQTVGCACRDT